MGDRGMTSFIARRILQAIPLLLFISMLIFAILSKAPGGPLAPYLQNPHLTHADVERLRHNFGLDQPVPIQYLHWLGQVVRGDFGYSTSNSMPVAAAIFDRLPATLELMGCAFFVSLLLGIAAGISAAVRPNSGWDNLMTTVAFFGQSMPVFWFALMLQLAFSVAGLKGFGYVIRLPSAGRCGADACSLGDQIVHLILPTMVLSLVNLATWSRFTRASMLEVLKSDYIRTAAAKGLSPFTILMKHGLRNALTPVVTMIALAMPSMVGGAVVTETIFAWPGMGRLFYTSLGQFDFALLMGYLTLVAGLVVFFNLLADVAYALLDPRVHLS
jgi:peptide/nickel transport system permease protein